MCQKPPLERAVELVGSQARLAFLCGKKPSHVWNWLNRDKKLPGEYVLTVAKATDFQVTPHDLRPDLYPNERDGMPTPGELLAGEVTNKGAS